MRNTFITGLLVATLFIAPFATSAQTVGDVQAQIQALLARVAELTAQLNVLRTQPQATVPGTSVGPAGPLSFQHRICTALYRNLAEGERGEDVRSLQEFLRAQGLLAVEPTGFFGALTREALMRWQASQGVVSSGDARTTGWGALGPQTRERIRIWCAGQSGPIPSQEFSASPVRGSAPLTVSFTANVQLTNPQFIADAGSYKIVFGDGAEHVFSCSNTASGVCPGPHSIRHTYASNGTYTAQLVHYGYYGPPPAERVIGTVTIAVGQPIACTMEYRPVCGQAPGASAPQTYGNRCTAQADGAHVLYEGQCRTGAADPSSDPRCRSWYDGCNSCSRSTPGGPAACTLRYCAPESRTAAYCTDHFGETGNQPPRISDFSGPSTLQVNETGTWTIRASDPENSQLSYYISWGDEAQTAQGLITSLPVFTQSTSFTHSYSVPGTYTINITARDPAGQEARVSTTVQVVGGAVACTADAMQCPNGQWVGRSGPNCQFVCN